MCADVLNASDQGLVMFPEGTRSSDGRIQPFKPGIGLLVAGTGRLVVPSYICGAYRAWPKGGAVPRPQKVTVIVGMPLSFHDRPRDKQSYQAIAQEVEDAVRSLSGRSR